MADETSRRRVTWRLRLALVVGLLVGVVALSERFDGPVDRRSIWNAFGSALSSARHDDGTAVAATDDGVVYLTFDDGPSLEWTRPILDVLDAHGVHAVFFPIGNQVSGGAELLRSAVAAGHRVGNHTWDHDELLGLDQAGFEATVGRTDVAIEAATGVTPRCLRPPGGRFDGTTVSEAAERGMSIEMWTIDSRDWEVHDPDAIVEHVLSSVTDGSVILFHDGGGDRSATVAAVDRILDRLADAGYAFDPLPRC